MPRCTILNCKSSTDMCSQVNRDVSFHRFPNDPHLKQKWIEATGKRDWFPTKYNTICSKHFNEASFVGGKKRRLLTTKAYPTIDVVAYASNEELNSNIMGSLVEVCRICLATDDEAKLYSLQYGMLKQYLNTILTINGDSFEENGLPQFVCSECAVHLRKCYSIIKKSETSQAILLDIYALNGEITKALVKNTDRGNLELKSPLESHNITPTYFYDYQYNYEQNISCLTKIEYIYDLNDNKVELDTKSHIISIQVEHNDDNDISVNLERDHSINNKIKLDIQSDIISKHTDNGYNNVVTDHLENNLNNENKIDIGINSDVSTVHTNRNIDIDANDNLQHEDSIENKVELDTNPHIISIQTTHNYGNDTTENLARGHIACNNSHDVNYINSSDNEDDTYVNKDENSTELSNVNTENVLKPIKKHIGKNNISNEIEASQPGKQPNKTKNKCEETSITKYFDIVQFKTLQEKIDEWRKSMENPSWVKNKRPTNNVYKCEVCLKLFANLQTYKQHSTVHDPILGSAECPVCKIRHKNEKTVKKHMNYLHSKRYYCKACPNSFSTQSAAAKHHSFHTGRVYKCSQCSFSSLHCSALNKHMAFIHSHAFACELCGRAYLNRKGLQQHRDKQHPGQTVQEIGNEYPCEQCNFSFTTEEALQVHLLTSVQHKELKRNASMRNTCRQCGRKFSSSIDLKAHVSSDHTGSQSQDNLRYPTVCEYCSEVVQSRHDHYWHTRRQHPHKKYQHVVTVVCEVCGRGFQKLAQLKRHKLRHSSPKVPCPVCQKLFYDKILVDQHVAEKHRAERPHACATCGSTFKNKPNLWRHMKIHTDLTPYECSLCGKQLKHKANLRVHIQTIHHKILCPSRMNPKKRSRKRKRDPKTDI